MTTDPLGQELMAVSRYDGPTRPTALDATVELPQLLTAVDLPVTGEGLLFLLDRVIERLDDPTLQEVARATFRRPPYNAEQLDSRLQDCAWLLSQKRKKDQADDPLRANQPVAAASLKTMRRRRQRMIQRLAPVLRAYTERVPQHDGDRGAEPRTLPGDRSEFLGDLTIPDGTLMRPGQTFEKRWEVRNAGTVPWTDRYLIRLGSTDAHSTPTTPSRVQIPGTRPGESVEIAIQVTAPRLPGTYEVHWKQADAHGWLYYPDRYWAGVWFLIVVPGVH